MNRFIDLTSLGTTARRNAAKYSPDAKGMVMGMDIAIIANDKKKELITEFCIAYCGILSRHKLCATATTAKYISDATGLVIEKLLAGFHGGSQQIASKISYDEIDVLILFRDPNEESEYAESELSLMRMCDLHNVPVATNIATAEAIIMALDRGDLDWRDNVKKSFVKNGTRNEDWPL